MRHNLAAYCINVKHLTYLSNQLGKGTTPPHHTYPGKVKMLFFFLFPHFSCIFLVTFTMSFPFFREWHISLFIFGAVFLLHSDFILLYFVSYWTLDRLLVNFKVRWKFSFDSCHPYLKVIFLWKLQFARRKKRKFCCVKWTFYFDS